MQVIGLDLDGFWINVINIDTKIGMSADIIKNLQKKYVVS